jgi:hypothetical protein
VTPSEYPPCACSIHPGGEDRRKYMFVAECSQDYVVFCCKRCSEIAREAVIQVRALKHARDKAQYEIEQQRRQLPPELLRMLLTRKRGGVRVREEQPL